MGAIPTIFTIDDPLSVWRFMVKTEFDADYVDLLKEHISPRKRKWVPEEKVWLFKAEVIDVVCKLLAVCFGTYQWAEEWKQSDPEPEQRNDMAMAYSTLCLTPAAPPGLLKAAYRWWAKETHPDRGGDHSRMVEINRAFEQIEAIVREAA